MICKECKQDKKHEANGLCRPCYNKIWMREYRKKHPDYNKEWCEQNPNYNPIYYQNNKEKISKQIKLYKQNNSERIREWARKHSRIYKEKYPEKRKAHQYVYRHKQRGNKCEIDGCEKITNLEFHHTDYKNNKGYTICRKHHRLLPQDKGIEIMMSGLKLEVLDG